MSVDSDTFRDTLAHWATGVAIAACRDGSRVVATTISAFMSLSLEPPLVLLALGPNATVRPFLQPGADFAISLLAADQRRLAMVYADPFPVGTSPFAAEGTPVVLDALAALACRAIETRVTADHLIVTAEVNHARIRHGAAPLIRYLRRYHEIAD